MLNQQGSVLKWGQLLLSLFLLAPFIALTFLEAVRADNPWWFRGWNLAVFFLMSVPVGKIIIEIVKRRRGGAPAY